MKRSEVVELIKETIRRIAPGAKTILYGSEARGDARPDSVWEKVESGFWVF